MTVQELIEKLRLMPPTALVLASSDEEGNLISELARVEDEGEAIVLYPTH